MRACGDVERMREVVLRSRKEFSEEVSERNEDKRESI